MLCAHSQATTRQVEPKGNKCMSVGYPSSQKGYKCCHPGKGDRVFFTMDVTFHEDLPYYSPEGKEVIHDDSKGKQVPLVQSIPPPSYQDKWMMTKIKT